MKKIFIFLFAIAFVVIILKFVVVKPEPEENIANTDETQEVDSVVDELQGIVVLADEDSVSSNSTMTKKEEQSVDSSGFMMKVDNHTVPFTKSPESTFADTKILNGKFNVGTIRQEGGLFELVDLDASKLKIGTFSGSEFKLMLIHSPYKETACTDIKFKENSELVITEYDDNIKGYYGGKLDCDNTIIEFKASFNEKAPTPEFYITN